MFNNVAIDVVIGLVFVYLLYSLLGTLLQEIIATNIGLRGWILENAIKRMLDDDKRASKGRNSTPLTEDFFTNIRSEFSKNLNDKGKANEIKEFQSIIGSDKEISYILEKTINKVLYGDKNTSNKIDRSVKEFFEKIKTEISKEPKLGDKSNTINKVLEDIKKLIEPIDSKGQDILFSTQKFSSAFYAHPLIKYLAPYNALIQKKPAYIEKESFSKVVIDLLRGQNAQPGTSDRQPIQNSLDLAKISWGKDVRIERETLSYMKSIWADSQGDTQKFKGILEDWFGEMMNRTTGWYKKCTQVILLIVGLSIAIAFNVDTIKIIKTLQNNPSIREQVLAQANAFSKAHPKLEGVPITRENDSEIKDKAKINKQDIQKDINAKLYNQAIHLVNNDISSVNNVLAIGWTGGFYKNFDCLTSILGWILTALAISMGAPFWFDLLNKLTQLRSSIAPKDDANTKAKAGTITTPKNIVG
jgi:hypothetical protein